VREIAASYLGSDSLSGALARAGLPRHYQSAAERASGRMAHDPLPRR
jgi:hypothetical protein